jgi:ferric-dicitrate binding protein FerR (iron transport regulator)
VSDDQDIEARLAALIADRRLPAEDEHTLRETLRERPELRAALIEDDRLDGMLRTLGRVTAEGETFVGHVAAQLPVEQDGERFASAVDRRIDGDHGWARRPARTNARAGVRLLLPGVALAAAAGLVLFVATRDRGGTESAQAPRPDAGRSFAVSLSDGDAGAASRPLAQNEALRLGPGAHAVIESPEGWRLEGYGPARVRVGEAARSERRIVLDEGAVSLTTADAAGAMSVETPEALATSIERGTRFWTQAENGRTVVRVESGLVRVSAKHGKGSRELRAGTFALVQRDDLLVRTQADPTMGSETVFRVDARSAAIRLGGGSLGPCPPGARDDLGSCFAGTRYNPRFRGTLGVRILSADGAPFFISSDDLVMEFDYWIGTWLSGPTPRLTAGVQTADGTFETSLAPPHPAPARWVTARVAVRDLQWRGKPLPAGQPVTGFKFGTEYGLQDVFHVGGVRIGRAADSTRRAP